MLGAKVIRWNVTKPLLDIYCPNVSPQKSGLSPEKLCCVSRNELHRAGTHTENLSWPSARLCPWC